MKLNWGPHPCATITDAALFYVDRRAPMATIVLPTNVQAHFERMLARPAMQGVRGPWNER